MSKKYRTDLTGQRFGRLIVLEFMPDEKIKGSWLCKCDCGKEKVILDCSLKSGGTKSCGCLQKEQMSLKMTGQKYTKGNTYTRGNYGESSFNSILKSYKSSSKRRNYEFSLSEEQFKILTKQNCFYCGKEPSSIINSKTCYGEYIYNGIDRVNNKEGYTLENCVPCCKICNIMKGILNKEEFLNQNKQIYEYNFLTKRNT